MLNSNPSDLFAVLVLQLHPVSEYKSKANVVFFLNFMKLLMKINQGIPPFCVNSDGAHSSNNSAI